MLIFQQQCTYLTFVRLWVWPYLDKKINKRTKRIKMKRNGSYANDHTFYMWQMESHSPLKKCSPFGYAFISEKERKHKNPLHSLSWHFISSVNHFMCTSIYIKQKWNKRVLSHFWLFFRSMAANTNLFALPSFSLSLSSRMLLNPNIFVFWPCFSTAY